MKKNKKLIIFIITLICFVISIYYNDNSIDKNLGNVQKVSNNTNNVKINDLLTIEYIDVGQADCILISSSNHNMLIDAGNNSDGKKLVSYFKEHNISAFDYVVATHAHEDHIGGIDDIIDNFNINNFFMPDALSTSKTFEDVLDSLDKNNMKYTEPGIGSTYDLGEGKFEIIYVDNKQSNLNNTSIVLRYTYGNNSFIFMGDLESKIEGNILNKNIKSDVLKVGHHGSGYSSSNSFLDKVNPSYAIISVGRNNVYKHPSLETIDRLNNRNIKVYRTDKDGTIILKSDGKDISVTTKMTNTNGD